jgi:hypothetical protein
MATFQSGKQRNVGWVGEDSHVGIPWWKRKHETVRCRDATASSFVAKVRGEVFAHFQAVAVKPHSSMRKLLFDLKYLLH